jgi:methylmalonyl-CoA mutase
MTAPSEHLDLAAEFPTPTRQDWRALVAGVLAKSGLAADADPELALASTTYDGIQIKPLYTADDAPYPLAATASPGQYPFVRGGRADAEVAVGWDVRQRHGGADAAATNEAILTDLENGVTSIWLTVGDGGVAVADLGRALRDVYLDLAPIALAAGADTGAAAAAFLDLARSRQVAATDLAGTLGADPIGWAAHTGTTADLTGLADLVRSAHAYPRLRAITIDGTIYHDAGAGAADEIAVTASAGVAYLRALTAAGLSVDDALDAIEFRYAVSDDQFESIAKLRAARRVWARVAELSDAAPAHQGQRQHAVTSAAMMTQRDPWVNMLRTTIACFAAAVAGADAVTVAPFDAALGPADDFSRRIARNTQSVLHDESSLARVTDPAGGSYYVESLTDQLARTAWDRFTALERAGGATDRAAVAALIAPTRAQRDDDVAHRRFPVTGVTEFPLVEERSPARVVSPTSSAGLPVVRYAAPFEALRDRTDAVAAVGARPAVFLAALGPVAAHSGRLGFASNLFQVAGLTPVVYEGEAEGIGAAFAESGARVACLCSSDKVYAEAAAPAAEALKSAGARTVFLAGQPGDRQDADAAAGIDEYVFVGSDALGALQRTLDDSEVPA